MSRRAGVAVLLVSMVAVASAQKDKPKPSPSPPAAKPKPGPSQSELAKLMAATDEIAARVSKLRGLPIKKPIARGIMSRKQVEERVRLRIDEEYAAVEMAEESRAMKRLGLFPDDADYKQVILTLLGDQIAGFYDPKVKELYIADWIEPDYQRMVMAHEIDHALQDQAYDLVSFVKPIKDNADEQLARQAVVEGDGIAVMVEFLTLEAGLKTDPWADASQVEEMRRAVEAGDMTGSLKSAPLVLREWLIFPYIGGLGLIAETRRHHPWSKVDEMYKKPPLSTEQILHPAKYFRYERPIEVKPAALPVLKSYKVVYTNVIGELVWDIFFRQHGVAAARAREAASGWGGDRYQVLAPSGDDGKKLDDLIVIDLSAWDTEADAIEAQEAATAALGTLTRSAQCSKTTYVTCTDPSGDVAILDRKANKLLLIIGAPAQDSARIRLEAWSKWR